MEKHNVSILIGMPIFESIPPEQFGAVLMIQRRAFESNPKVQLDFCIQQRTTIVQARNAIIDQFVQHKNYDYLLWLDDDNPPEYPYDSVEKLLKYLQNNKDAHAVSALIKSRDDSHYTVYTSVGEIGQDTPQYIPFIPPLSDRDDNVPFEADAVGFGMVLMDRESVTAVYEKFHAFPVAQGLMSYVQVAVPGDDPRKVELTEAVQKYHDKIVPNTLSLAHLSENFVFWSRLTTINKKYKPMILPEVVCYHIAKKYVYPEPNK